MIKSRVQGDGWGAEARYTSPLHCLRESLAKEGYSVLYRGFGSSVYRLSSVPNTPRAFLVNAVVLGVYNLVMKMAPAL